MHVLKLAWCFSLAVFLYEQKVNTKIYLEILPVKPSFVQYSILEYWMYIRQKVFLDNNEKIYIDIFQCANPHLPDPHNYPVHSCLLLPKPTPTSLGADILYR